MFNVLDCCAAVVSNKTNSISKMLQKRCWFSLWNRKRGSLYFLMQWRPTETFILLGSVLNHVMLTWFFEYVRCDGSVRICALLKQCLPYPQCFSFGGSLVLSYMLAIFSKAWIFWCICKTEAKAFDLGKRNSLEQCNHELFEWKRM